MRVVNYRDSCPSLGYSTARASQTARQNVWPVEHRRFPARSGSRCKKGAKREKARMEMRLSTARHCNRSDGEAIPGFAENRGRTRQLGWKVRQLLTPQARGGLRRASRKLKLGAARNYERAASLKALAARRRTTVLALILMASPVCGLRPMRALRWAFTARPILGMTNFPAAPLHSLTASLKSSSKNIAAVFFGVPHFSAMYATIFDLLIGFDIWVVSPRRKWVPAPRELSRNALGGRAGHTIAKRARQRKGKAQKTLKKCGFRGIRPREAAWEAGFCTVPGVKIIPRPPAPCGQKGWNSSGHKETRPSQQRTMKRK